MSAARQSLPCYADALYTRAEVLARLPGNAQANRAWLDAHVPASHASPGGSPLWEWSVVLRALRAVPAPAKNTTPKRGAPKALSINRARGGRR